MSETLVADKRLHPATLAIGFVRILPQCVLGPPILARYVIDAGYGLMVLFGIAGLFAAMGYAWLAWRRFGYAVADGQLVIEQGIFNRNRRTIPFDRIQDVSLEQKLLGRIFGVATVRVETGSGDSDEGLLDAIGIGEAAALRDAIRRHRAAGPGDASVTSTASTERSEPTGPPLFAMGIGRLLILGLFSFSFVFVALLGSIGQFAFSWLPTRYADPANYIDMSELPVSTGAVMTGMLAWSNSLAIGLLVIAAGMISGLAKVITRDFGFRLTRTETGLRRERGLFTRTDVVMPLRRVQAAIVSTGIVRKLFGWQALALQSIGTDTDKETNHIVAPLARAGELAPILRELGLDPPPDRADFTPISPRTVSVSALASVAAAVGALCVGAAIERLTGNPVGYLALIAASVPLARALLRRYGHRWHIAAGQLFVRKGIASQGVTILDRVKIQSVTIRRGPVQRLFGLATLIIGTAGASRSSPLSIVDLAEADARRLMDGWMIGGGATTPDIANSPAIA